MSIFLELALRRPRNCAARFSRKGSEVLRRRKHDRKLRRIPVLMLLTSDAEADVHAAYDTHANGYITKPGDTDALAAIVETIERFWITVSSFRQLRGKDR